jgi:hypothetical protein
MAFQGVMVGMTQAEAENALLDQGWTYEEQYKDSVNDEKDLCFSRILFEEQESTVDITVKNDRVTTIDYYQ